MSLIEANRLASFGLVVLIWLVQLVVYPAFRAVAAENFIAWHAGYTRAMGRIVGPLMLVQAALLACLLATRPSRPAAAAALLVATAWAVTAFQAVPAHEKLAAGGPDPALISRLIAMNRIRTAAWTLAFLCLMA